MQCVSLPSKIQNGIDTVRISFGEPPSPPKKKGIGLVGIKLPNQKKESGLGFQTTKGRNTAVLAKLN